MTDTQRKRLAAARATIARVAEGNGTAAELAQAEREQREVWDEILTGAR
jgi:hypothetical protein